MIDAVSILALVGGRLAVSFYDIVKQLSADPQELKNILKDLNSRHLIKERALGKEDVLYTITAEGAKELERKVKRGVSAAF